MIHPVLQPDFFEHAFSRGPRLLEPVPADQPGHHHVFEGGEFRQQMVKLKNKADLPIAEFRQPLVGSREDVFSIEADGPAGRTIEGSQNMQEGRLSYSRRSDNGHDFATLDLQADAVEHMDVGLAQPERLVEIDCGNHQSACAVRSN